MKINWFKLIVILILFAGVGVYGWSEYNNSQLAKEKQREELQLQKEKQDNDLKIQQEQINLKKQEDQNAITKQEADKQQEELANNQKISEKNQRDKNRDNCLSNAQAEYNKRWDALCSNGIGEWVNNCQGEQGPGCVVCGSSDQNYKDMQAFLKDTKDECYKKYPVSL